MQSIIFKSNLELKKGDLISNIIFFFVHPFIIFPVKNFNLNFRDYPAEFCFQMKQRWKYWGNDYDI